MLAEGIGDIIEARVVVGDGCAIPAHPDSGYGLFLFPVFLPFEEEPAGLESEEFLRFARRFINAVNGFRRGWRSAQRSATVPLRCSRQSIPCDRGTASSVAILPRRPPSPSPPPAGS